MKGFESQSTTRISLQKALSRSRFLRASDFEIDSVCTNPDQIEVGDILFVIEEGLRAVNAASTAMARGAAGVVTESLLPLPIAQCLVPDVHQAITEASNALADKPGSKLITIGVAGPHGKLCTTLAIGAVLREAGLRCAYHSDMGSSDGIVQGERVPAERTGEEFVQWLAGAVDAECAAAVVELDDRSVLSGAAAAAQLDILVVTGSNSDILLLESIDLLGPEGVLLVRSDDSRIVRLAEQSGRPMLTFGLEPDADFSGSIFQRDRGETTLMVTAGDTTQSLRTKWIGPWMARHQLAAVGVGMLLQASLQQCTTALSRLAPLPGRLQTIGRMDGPRVVLDAADRADRVRTALRTLRGEPCGEIWCVLEVNDVMDIDELAALARAAEKYSDRVILTSGGSGEENFLQAAHAALDGIVEPSRVHICGCRRRAVNEALSCTSSGDTILVTRYVSDLDSHTQRRVWESERRLVDRLQSKNAVFEDTGNPMVLKHPSLQTFAENG